MMQTFLRGTVWKTSHPAITTVLIISSTVYNGIADEPTLIIMPAVTDPPETGFSVPLGDGRWAVTGLVTYFPKESLDAELGQVDVQTLTDVNNMLFKILATPST